MQDVPSEQSKNLKRIDPRFQKKPIVVNPVQSNSHMNSLYGSVISSQPEVGLEEENFAQRFKQTENKPTFIKNNDGPREPSGDTEPSIFAGTSYQV